MRVAFRILTFTFLFLPFFAQADDFLVGGSSVSSPSQSNWGYSFFNLTSGEAERVNQGGASWFSYNYLSFNYRKNWSERFSIRPTFSIESAGVKDRFGNTRPMETALGDVHFVYSNFNLASFPGEWDLAGRFYLYAPTSKSSQEKRQIFRVRSWLTFQNVLNRYWTFAYHIEPQYYQQSQKAYRSESVNISPSGRTFNNVQARLNKVADLDHRIEIQRYLNETFTASSQVGLAHSWFHDSEQIENADLLREELSISFGSWISVMRGLRLLATVESGLDVRNPRQGDTLFSDRTTQYVLMTFWTIQ